MQSQQDLTPYFPDMGGAWDHIGSGQGTVSGVVTAWEHFETPLTRAYMDTVEVQRWNDDHINIEIELTSPEDGSQWVIDIGATAEGSWIDVQPAAGADGFDFAPGAASWDARGGYEYGSGSTAQDTAWLDSLYGSGGSYARWSHTGTGGSADSYGDWSFGDGYNAYGIFGADDIY